jgi:hypothetical protein
MMTRNKLRPFIRFIFSVLILGLTSNALLSQTDTIINRYAKVVSRSDYQVTVDNASGFIAGDYALLIQMKGVSIDPVNNGGYGNIAEILGTPGQYEFVKVNTVAGNIITFLSKIKNYNVDGFVQLVRVPFFNSAKFNKTLTCERWNAATGTGGVFAIIVGRDLTLNSDIDVSGKGFYGGAVDIGIGGCAVPAGINNTYSFPATFDNAGYKGEGIASHYSPTLGTTILLPTPLKGQGRLFSGGGGGNGRFSGGGGGSNRGTGYDGGNEDNLLCKSNTSGGGNGGFSVTSYTSIDDNSNTGGIFMGGGGGSSTYLAGASATAGGNGGGIVFIIADSLNGNSRSIMASGDSALTATGITSGAGGGGAGGSIIIFSKKYSSSILNIKVNGGKGGDVYHSYLLGDEGGGPGGGGGGGYITTLLPAIPSNISPEYLGGAGSYVRDVSGSLPELKANEGKPGLLRTNVIPVLTGFLFNSIASDKTGNQIDSTCSNVPYSQITGTEPMGGTLPYSIKWQKSTVSESTGYVDIPEASGKINFSPGSLTQTTWFKRVITDAGAPAIVDNSKPVMIIVHPAILNNIIVADPDTICFKGDPQILKQGSPDLIVPTSKYLKYIWQDSTFGGVWGPELAPESDKEFDPAPSGGLTKDTWYRRIVKSGSCIDQGAVAKVTILPKISDNAFSKLNDTICFGGNTNLNTNSGPTGGDNGKYTYKWESSTVSSTGPWAPAGSTSQSYDPDASVPLPVGNHFYRRIVFSGELNACKDTTKPGAVRKVWPVITNNLIKADQTIGYDSIPLTLTETSGAPLGGDGLKYNYFWVKDTLTYPSAPVGSNGINKNEYQPPKLRHTVSFIRIVRSSACADTSNSVKIQVDSPISNNITLANAALDIIYTGQVSSKLNGSVPTGGSGIPDDYSYKWYKSFTGGPSQSEWILISDSVRINIYPGTLTEPTWFRRDVSSPKLTPRSTYQSNFLKVTVLPKITNVNITANQAICYSDRPLQLKGSSALTGGDGKYTFTWQDSTSTHNWQNITNFIKCDSANYKPPALTAETRFKRIVYSGKNDCGVENSNSIIVKVNPLPGVPYAGPDTLIHSVEKIYHMLAAKPASDENGIWEVLDNGTGTFANPSSNNTVVRALSPGKNSFLWTVNKGLCKLKDTVTIELLGEFIPQGFSPNGDAWNNTFIIEGLNLEDQFVDLSIVNSAGSEVYSTSNRAPQKWADWDGKNSKGFDLPEGTYYYLLKITSDPSKGGNGQVFKSKGFIILKRY